MFNLQKKEVEHINAHFKRLEVHVGLLNKSLVQFR